MQALAPTQVILKTHMCYVAHLKHMEQRRMDQVNLWKTLFKKFEGI